MSNANKFVLKGNLLYSKSLTEITSCPAHYLVCEDGKVAGIHKTLPSAYATLPLYDYGDKLIIPGFTDLHVHAPQYAFRGLGMDLELLDWLDQCTFPEESKYVDIPYAQSAYRMFVDALQKSSTTRACIFATLHVPATLLLMDMLEQSGLHSMVGKVNMDRNSPDNLCETPEQSLQSTREWLAACKGRYENTQPILTPRFTPSCTDGLMASLAELQKETGLPLQSHLSENLSEVEWVKGLCPGTSSYGESYNQHGVFGGDNCPTVMAHCVHPHGNETELLRENGVYVAHCPQSNTNLASGIAPVRMYLENGIKVALGSDVAGGDSLSMFRTISETIKVSKLRWRLIEPTEKPLSVAEAFYLATKGGGSFFGNVGSFEDGYEFDAVVLDDDSLPCPNELDPTARLERIVYLSGEQAVTAKFVAGTKVL